MVQHQRIERHQRTVQTASETVQQQCGLPDVVQEVPHLLVVLHPRSRSALSGCNTQLRHIFHSWTTAVLIENQSHLQTLLKGYWPQLAVVVLHKQHFDLSWSQYETDNLQLVAALDMWQGAKCSVLLVASKMQQQAGLIHGSTSATAASVYLTARCVDVYQLALRQKKGTYGIAQLALIKWCSLNILDLSDCELEPVDMRYLMEASMLQLSCLVLTYNNLGSEGIEALVSACLPQLCHLNLDDTHMDASAAKHLAKGDWPNLDYLVLYDNRLDDMAMMHVAEGLWPKLQFLEVKGNPIGGLGLQRLTKGRWPKLRCLTVDFTMLSSAFLTLLDIHDVMGLSLKKGKYMDLRRDFASHDFGQPLIWPSLKEVLCWGV